MFTELRSLKILLRKREKTRLCTMIVSRSIAFNDKTSMCYGWQPMTLTMTVLRTAPKISLALVWRDEPMSSDGGDEPIARYNYSYISTHYLYGI